MTLQDFTSTHNMVDGSPTGGKSEAQGIVIVWQAGPLGQNSDRVEPNGAFVETLLAIVKDRMAFYQEHFACDENAQAITHLDAAIKCLKERTERREAEGTEGTHDGS